MVFDDNKEIIQLLNLIPKENIIIIRQKNILLFCIDSFKAIIFFRKQKIDTTVDMEFFTRAPIIYAYLSGAKKRIGLDRFTSEGPYRGNIITHKVQYNHYLHTSINYSILAECLFLNKDLDLPLLKIEPSKINIKHFKYLPNKPEKEKAYQQLGIEKNNKKRIILLNPNASDLLPLRKWETINFINLAKKLLTKYKDALIYITGSPSEKEKAEEINSIIDSPRCQSIAGKTTLKELIIIYTITDLIVTNDSGPGLFASLTNIKSIVLFGPETPLLFGSCITK